MLTLHNKDEIVMSAQGDDVIDKEKEDHMVDFIQTMKAIEDAMEPYKDQRRELRSDYRRQGWLTREEMSVAVKAYRLMKGEVDLERFRIKRIQVGKGNVMETNLVNGLMLLKSRVDISSSKDSGSGNVAIIDGGLERAKLEINASIEVESPEALKEFH